MKRLPLSIAALAWLACFLGQRSYAQLQASWIQPAPQPQVVSSCMAVDGAGRSVHGGWKVGLDGSSAATLTLYDALGNLLWARVFAAQLSERIYALGFDSTGNIVAAGRRAGFVGTTFISDVVLWKLDLAGNVLWSTMYDDGANGSESASKLALTPTDEIVVLGFAGPLTPGEDVGVWKFAANGSLIWARRVDGSQHLDDAGSQLALASDGSIYATALVNSVLGVSSDAAVLKLDANGTLLWQREFGPSGATLDLPGAIVLGAQGDVYVSATLFAGSDPSAVLLRLDASGNVVWTRPSVAPTDGGGGITIDHQGRIVVTSFRLEAISDPTLRIESYDRSGNLLWARERAHTHLWSQLVDAGGDVFVLGSTLSGPAQADAFVARYDAQGTLRWTFVPQSLSGAPIEGLTYCALGPGGSLYCAGAPANHMFALRLDPLAQAYCFGDGSASACPCGNASSVGEREGCRNSLGAGGKLQDGGNPSLSADTFTLTGSHMPNSSVLYFQGTQQIAGGAGAAFGDGLRCAGGTIVRVATHTNVAGSSSYPQSGEPSISTRGLIGAPGTRTYQAWYRNNASFCTSATFNMTNALLVLWQS